MTTSNVPEQDRLADAVVWGLGKGARASDSTAAIIEPVSYDVPVWDLEHSNTTRLWRLVQDQHI